MKLYVHISSCAGCLTILLWFMAKMNRGNDRTKHRVTHQCGHERTVSVFEGKSLEQWVSKLEATDCPSCWLKKQPVVFSSRISTRGPAIDVFGGFPIREELKARGYSFRRPCWTKWFETELERDQELDWVRESGYEIEGS